MSWQVGRGRGPFLHRRLCSRPTKPQLTDNKLPTPSKPALHKLDLSPSLRVKSPPLPPLGSLQALKLASLMLLISLLTKALSAFFFTQAIHRHFSQQEERLERNLWAWQCSQLGKANGIHSALTNVSFCSHLTCSSSRRQIALAKRDPPKLNQAPRDIRLC